eukprot:763418-Hanusia_phi.AAC.3
MFVLIPLSLPLLLSTPLLTQTASPSSFLLSCISSVMSDSAGASIKCETEKEQSINNSYQAVNKELLKVEEEGEKWEGGGDQLERRQQAAGSRCRGAGSRNQGATGRTQDRIVFLLTPDSFRRC